MAGLRAVIEHKGLFCSLYSDREPISGSTPKSGGKVDYERPTAGGPRHERTGSAYDSGLLLRRRGGIVWSATFSTWQGRLPQELRLRGIRTLEAANKFLVDHYIAESNLAVSRFRQPSASTAFIPRAGTGTWKWCLRNVYERTVDSGQRRTFPGHDQQLERAHWRHTLRRIEADHPSAYGHEGT